MKVCCGWKTIPNDWPMLSNLEEELSHLKASRQNQNFRIAVEYFHRANNIVQFKMPGMPQWFAFIHSPRACCKRKFSHRWLMNSQPVLTNLTFIFKANLFSIPSFWRWCNTRQKNILPSTSTNAHYLNDEQARKTVESGLIDLSFPLSVGQETYEQYRVGGQPGKVLEEQKIPSRGNENWNQNPHVVPVFGKSHEQDIRDYILVHKEWCWRRKLKIAQIYDYENGSEPILNNPKHLVTQRQNVLFWIKNPF